MEIVLADVLGFCFGVRRAIQLAEAAAHGGRSVNSLGPLVHNAQETLRLDRVGISTVNDVEELRGDAVVVRAHGARPETFRTLEQRGFRLVDATCPFVKSSQRIAQEFDQQGLTLVIVGHQDHPEVQGILGYTSSPAYIITLPDDVARLPDGITPGVIAQTTVNEQTFLEIVGLLTARYPGCEVRNTVCFATRERQQAARRLATRVDAVYVIGGRHSSNTNRLTEICRQVCARTFLIETAEEIEPSALSGLARVGVTAGASTPDWLIDHVVERLRALGGVEVEDRRGEDRSPGDPTGQHVAGEMHPQQHARDAGGEDYQHGRQHHQQARPQRLHQVRADEITEQAIQDRAEGRMPAGETGPARDE